MPAVAGVQIFLESQDFLLHHSAEILLPCSFRVGFRRDLRGLGLGIPNDFRLLNFRLMEQFGRRAAHFRVQTGNADLSCLQFLQFLHGNGQLTLQLIVFPVQRIEFFGQKIYVLIHLGGGVSADGAGEFVISYFLRQ